MALAFPGGHAAQGSQVIPQDAQRPDHLSRVCESRPPIAHLCRLKIISSHLEMHPFADEIRRPPWPIQRVGYALFAPIGRLRGYARLDLLGPTSRPTS
jgi:hypothetical protein